MKEHFCNGMEEEDQKTIFKNIETILGCQNYFELKRTLKHGRRQGIYALDRKAKFDNLITYYW